MPWQNRKFHTTGLFSLCKALQGLIWCMQNWRCKIWTVSYHSYIVKQQQSKILNLLCCKKHLKSIRRWTIKLFGISKGNNEINSTEVQSPWRKLHDKCLCLSYVFSFVLACMCKVCSRVSETLSLALLTLSLTNNSSPDSKAFLWFIAFSGSPTAVHHLLHALQYYTVGIPFWTACKRQS